MNSPPITLASNPSTVTPPFVPCTDSAATCLRHEALAASPELASVLAHVGTLLGSHPCSQGD